MKVLVPVDGSKYALEALNVAIDFVKTKGGEISVISVVPYIGGMDDHEISPARRERHMETFEKRADEIVKQACDILSRRERHFQLHEEYCHFRIDCGCHN